MSNHGVYNPNRRSGSGSGGLKRKYFNLKDGDNLFRILPPFKTLSKTGDIAKYWSVFWLKDSEGRNRAVPSILRKGKEGVVLQRDPILDKIDALKKMVEDAAQRGENPVVVEQLRQKVKDHEPDKAYYLNVLTPSGEIGSLKIRYTAYQNLQEKLKSLAKDGIDAINSGPGNGIFFNFKKIKDEKGKTLYPVDMATRSVRDPVSNKLTIEYMEAPIDDNILGRMESEAFDLANMYEFRSAEEMAELATLDVNVITKVFMRSRKVEEVTEDESTEEDSASTSAPLVNKSAQQQTQVVQQTVSTPVQQTQVVQQTVSTPVQQTQQAQAKSVLDDDMVKKFLFSGNSGNAG